MMLFESRLKPFQNFIGSIYIGLIDIDFLEASGQGAIFLEDASVFLIGS